MTVVRMVKHGLTKQEGFSTRANGFHDFVYITRDGLPNFLHALLSLKNLIEHCSEFKLFTRVFLTF